MIFISYLEFYYYWPSLPTLPDTNVGRETMVAHNLSGHHARDMRCSEVNGVTSHCLLRKPALTTFAARTQSHLKSQSMTILVHKEGKNGAIKKRVFSHGKCNLFPSWISTKTK